MTSRLLTRGLFGARLHEVEEIRDAIVAGLQSHPHVFERDTRVPQRAVGTGTEHRDAESSNQHERGEHRREAADAEAARLDLACPRGPRGLEAAPDRTIGRGSELLAAEALERGEEAVVTHRSTTTPASAKSPVRFSSLRRRSSPRCCRFQIAFSALSRSFATSAAL